MLWITQFICIFSSEDWFWYDGSGWSWDSNQHSSNNWWSKGWSLYDRHVDHQQPRWMDSSNNMWLQHWPAHVGPSRWPMQPDKHWHWYWLDLNNKKMDDQSDSIRVWEFKGTRTRMSSISYCTIRYVKVKGKGVMYIKELKLKIATDLFRFHNKRVNNAFSLGKG